MCPWADILLPTTVGNCISVLPLNILKSPCPDGFILKPKDKTIRILLLVELGVIDTDNPVISS